MPRQEKSFFQTWKIKLLRNAPRELLAPKKLEFENELGALQGESILIKVTLREPLPSCGRGLSALAGEASLAPRAEHRRKATLPRRHALQVLDLLQELLGRQACHQASLHNHGVLFLHVLWLLNAAAGFSGQSGKATLAAP